MSFIGHFTEKLLHWVKIEFATRVILPGVSILKHKYADLQSLTMVYKVTLLRIKI